MSVRLGVPLKAIRAVLLIGAVVAGEDVFYLIYDAICFVLSVLLHAQYMSRYSASQQKIRMSLIRWELKM
jgi:hypothetical protein